MDKPRCVSGIAGHALVLGGSGGLGAEIVRSRQAAHRRCRSPMGVTRKPPTNW